MTNLPASKYPGQKLYEHAHCARGEMQKCIKEQQLALLADRTGKLMLGLHRLARWGTEWWRAQCQTMRLKLCKSRQHDTQAAGQGMDAWGQEVSIAMCDGGGVGPAATHCERAVSKK